MAKHPARELGQWLKVRRREQGIVLRVFAGRVHLSPAEYAEVEAGVVRWIGKEQENVIPEVLALGEREAKKFNNMLSSARDARPLELRDVYTREQLEPMRTRGDAQLTDETRAELLDAVFKPLA